ncbi:MAG: phosphoribosylformylglycinamidine synthase [Lachnospiraceae bacterium]|nr:phosphoribosylformylglycinamidine synthase [Lachnospiraceae bacterium]
MSSVKRIYVEKKPEFAVQAQGLEKEIKSYLNIHGLKTVRILNRYDVEGLSEETFRQACQGIFAEPPLDVLYHEVFPVAQDAFLFSVEYLPGQFDQRADSAEQCIGFIQAEEKPTIRSATTYVLEGSLGEEELLAIKNHCINPVDSREIGMEKPETLALEYDEPADVVIFEGFIILEKTDLEALYDSLGLAMTFEDFLHIQNYFQTEEKRNPSVTEIRVLDTYWSDHCRHTTFSTELKDIRFADGFYKEPMETAYRQYLADHSEIFKGREDKFVCLMDLALMAMRKLKKEGKLKDQEESEEINACSIVVPIEVDGIEEEWLLNFKNETHNHPTEIEPFGGAATCLGGAIRDPLSGRTYVYQAMRVTGAADPTCSVDKTMVGKLPQKKIVREAAYGYSSYGNQIGLSTGVVKEIYHPDYVAKRMEIGAVLGAAPRRAVVRETASPYDIVILLGGRTGRDGCGGATGSSKVHTTESIAKCGAEVQKGNPPTERKLQRLFRREEVSKLIKKCNDFGAGGVSVAIGELADGLRIDLDKVPKKYAGLDGTEIAISESQERMAVVINPKHVDTFLAYAAEENLEAVQVAVVTVAPRLVLLWRDKEIVNLSRAFLDTNGAHQETDVMVEMPERAESLFIKAEHIDVKEKWLATLADLNVCSQKGLVELFDGSIGAGSVLMPHGGKFQDTETQAMVAKMPVLKGKTDAVSMMSFGFDPYLSAWSPFHGAVYAVIESVAKIVATGGDDRTIRFTFQEYFRRMSKDPKRWSQPFLALLGAYQVQMGLGLPSIGGKDSMSGTFQDIDVPPTLVSFAVNMAKSKDIISPELKQAGNKLLWLRIEKDKYDLPNYKKLMEQYGKFHRDVLAKRIVSAYALDRHGVLTGLSKMAFGNRFGLQIAHTIEKRDLFVPAFGDIVAEVPADQMAELQISYTMLGEVKAEQVFLYEDVCIPLERAREVWASPLEQVFPTTLKKEDNVILSIPDYKPSDIYICKNKVAKPTVFIPVFPGTNCEYDSARAFEEAGANVEIKVFRNLHSADIHESIKAYVLAIEKSQIMMFPGGFSAGDEPDGSAKFFATAFQNEYLKEAVEKLLNRRDGLILGICNGFQALMKLGLLPYGEIVRQTEHAPTLTYNTMGRHISKMVYTKVVSHKSPWLQGADLGGVYVNPVSHGEGRFVAPKEWLDKLFGRGQVATQYCDLDGIVRLGEDWNVNGSYGAIEGITSPDGRVFGKMAHSERKGETLAINIHGAQDLKIFESGVAYFR